jgi:hypothetical protein
MNDIKNYYAGIGSRQTPTGICERFTKLASELELLGYILRSGGADGADAAFEKGVKNDDNKEIWLPWKNFNKNKSILFPTDAGVALAAKYHPNWRACDGPARRLHGRNSHQVLGGDLRTPVHFVVCWTQGGLVGGGTSQALRIATDRGIRIFNFYCGEPQQMFDEILEYAKKP